MKVALGDTVLGTFMAGNPFVLRVPLPENCKPGTRLNASLQCVEDGLEGPAESVILVCPEPPLPPGGTQRPGDCNQDGVFDISDAICLLGYLYLGNPKNLPCGTGSIKDEGNILLLDHNSDSNIDISDGIAILRYLFLDGQPPPLGAKCAAIVGCGSACKP